MEETQSTTYIDTCIYICIYIYIYIYIFEGFAPAAGPLGCREAAWLLNWKQRGYCCYLNLLFWTPWSSFLNPWDTILVILGSRGTPNGHTEAQMSVFIDFFLKFGSLSGPTLGTFSRVSVIWDDRKENSFQVHDFGGPGMEIIVECIGCMRHKQCKNNVLWVISLFWFI